MENSKCKFPFSSLVMLTLDEMTLFFYSYILSSLDNNKPGPPKKCRGNCDVSKWLYDTNPISSPQSRSPSPLTTKHTASHDRHVTVGSSCMTTASVLTQGINITQKKVPLKSQVKALERYIKVAEDGAILDYDETQGAEQDAVMASPVKGKQCCLLGSVNQ